MPKAMSPAEAALRKHALSYPEAHEDFPWGERVGSASFALGLPFALPTAYGLGKSGWVTARFARREKPPLELLMKWIDESYRAVAPKRLVAALDEGWRKRPPAAGPAQIPAESG